jgi:hypothetical protein
LNALEILKSLFRQASLRQAQGKLAQPDKRFKTHFHPELVYPELVEGSKGD